MTINATDDKAKVISLDGLMTREEYEARLHTLRICYPFLPENAILDPNPGGLKPLETFMTRLKRAVGNYGLEFLEVREGSHGRVNAFLDPAKKLPLGRSEAIELARKEFVADYSQVCPLCGATLPEGSMYVSKPTFCAAHEELGNRGARLYEDAVAAFKNILAETPIADSIPKVSDEALEEDVFDFDAETVAEQQPLPSMTVRLFDPLKIDALEKWGKTRGDRDSRNRVDAVIRDLRKTDGLRKLAPLPEKWQQRLDELEEIFPNFSPFIDFLRFQFALGEAGTQTVSFSPVILNGSPGIGKSEILNQLAEVLMLPSPLCLDFSTAQSSSQLVGSASYWANSHESEVFKRLVQGEYANPIIYLDEIEKASGEGRYNPQSALYSMLEKTSAMKFQDLSLTDFPLDASHLLWVAAGNNVQIMDAPLRSRFTIIEIPEPTTRQMRSIHASIFLSFIASEPWGHLFEPLPESTIDALTGLTPREAKNLMRIGAGRARYEGRNHVLPEDVRQFTRAKRLAAGFVSELKLH